MTWQVRETPNAIHVIPLHDWISHEETGDCVCGPTIEYLDPDTSENYDPPLVIHYALDLREKILP